MNKEHNLLQETRRRRHFQESSMRRPAIYDFRLLGKPADASGTIPFAQISQSIPQGKLTHQLDSPLQAKAGCCPWSDRADLPRSLFLVLLATH